MHLLMADQIICDTVDFVVPRTMLSTTHRTTMAEQFAAACEFVGIELIEYHAARFIPVQDKVAVQFRGDGWIRKAQGR